MANLVELVKQAALEAVAAAHPAQAVFGKVTDTEPLAVRIHQKLRLTAEFLALSETVRTKLAAKSLRPGDTLLLLQQQGGQRFLALDVLPGADWTPPAAAPVTWADIAGKPAAFPPAPHAHTAAEVGALPAETFIPQKLSELQNDAGYITNVDNVDADTVDGHHATDFATAAQGKKADAALPSSGGTISGGLNITGSLSWPDQYRIKYQEIPNGSNLNNYMQPGFYRSQSSDYTQANVPPGINGAFELIVTGIADGTYCTQRVKDYRNNTEWFRTQTNWTTPWSWTDWSKALSGSVTWEDISGKPATFAPAAHIQAIANGGTGATSASGALSNLGAMPLSYGQSVALWTGVCNRGSSITIPNANKYGALIVYCTPGSGESEVITCIYRARGYKFQIASNQAYCLLSATDSGDNKVFTVDSGSSSGATLNGVYGLSRFKA